MGGDGRKGAGRAVGPHPSAGWGPAPGAVGQDGGGQVEDLGGRAVVVVEADHGGLAAVGHRGQQFGVGAVPPVDGLVRVADDEQVGAVAQPLPQQGVLERVHVLELVDVEVAVAPADRGGVVGVGPQVPGGEGQEVVEVDQSLPPLLLGVADHDLGQVGGRDGGLASGGGGRGAIVVGFDRAGPGPVDLGHHVDRVDPSVATGQLGHEADLAVEQLRWSDAPLGPALAELGQGGGVEGAGRDLVAQAESPLASSQLDRGLAGEGEGEDPSRVGLASEDPPGDAPGQHPGLARSGPGQDDDRAAFGGDGVDLGPIETVEQSIGAVGIRRRATERWCRARPGRTDPLLFRPVHRHRT